MSSQELITGLLVIGSLVIIEGLLSVDNVLGIAALAKELPEYQQKSAIRLGLAGAYVFRVLALLVATWLISNTWVRWLGAGYLVWLMCSHLTRRQTDPDEDGKVRLVRASFAAVLLQIGFMDLSLSIDNIIAAVGLAPKDPASGLPSMMWPIYVGVGIAILALQAIAPHAVTLLKRYPVLEPAAFVLIGYVGGILIYEETHRVVTGETDDVSPWVKFTGILIIIGLALLYSRHLFFKRLLRPLLRAACPAMKAFATAVDLVFLPVKLLISALKPKPADVVD
jgi:YkoY family integral membrane protein